MFGISEDDFENHRASNRWDIRYIKSRLDKLENENKVLKENMDIALRSIADMERKMKKMRKRMRGKK